MAWAEAEMLDTPADTTESPRPSQGWGSPANTVQEQNTSIWTLAGNNVRGKRQEVNQRTSLRRLEDSSAQALRTSSQTSAVPEPRQPRTARPGEEPRRGAGRPLLVQTGHRLGRFKDADEVKLQVERTFPRDTHLPYRSQ